MGTGGGNPRSVPFSSSSQAAENSPDQCPLIVSQEHYGRDATTSLRSSASVPAFATYWKVVPPERPSHGVNTNSIPLNRPPLHFIREGSPLPKLPKVSPRPPKTEWSANGGNTSVPGNYPSGPRWWGQGRAATGLFILAILLLFSGFLLGRLYWRKEALQFAVVIDGGSTGTRVNVYAWAHSRKDPLPVMVKPTYSRDNGAPWYRVPGQQRAYKRVETEPGLDKTLNNETGVRYSLEPLLRWAQKQIPPSAHAATRLFLLATAGLRRLPTEQSEWILDSAWSVLQESPFMCQRKWVKVISGVEEAYYGWIALNYNFGKLGHNPKVPNVGTLDLGGSSFQVTFEPEEVSREYSVNVSVGSTEHHLYALSHAGFGLNDAFEKSVAHLLRPQAASTNGVVMAKNGLVQVEHPCLHKGYRKPYVCSTHCMLPPLAFGSRSDSMSDKVAQVELIGAAKWDACQTLVEKVINTSRGGVCAAPPCALGKHQPPPRGKFYGLAGFFVVYKFFGLKSAAPLNKLLKKGQKFCELNWHQAQANVVPQPSVDRYCFRAPYVVALLRQGLHLQDDQITVGSGDFAWTLGAALWEAGALLPTKTQHEKVVLARTANTRIAISMGLLLMLAAILGVVTCHLRGKMRLGRRLYLPLFKFSTSTFSGTMWPLSLRAHGRLGSLTTGGLGRGKLALCLLSVYFLKSVCSLCSLSMITICWVLKSTLSGCSNLFF